MMGWFGPTLGLAIADELEPVDTPAGLACVHCHELIDDDDSGVRRSDGPVHVECFMRPIVGGVNHQLGRCCCCGGSEPPDPPGMTGREAARAAFRLIRNRGQG